MQTQTTGPDYVALIIEWDDSEEPTLVVERKSHVPYALIQVASVAVGAIALAAWGIHRLHSAAV